MNILRLSKWMMAAALGAATVTVGAQNPPQTPTPAASPAPASAPPPRKKAARRAPALKVIPMETAAPTPPVAAGSEAQQKAADQKLLLQQQARSERDAQVTNQQVQKAQKQHDDLQTQGAGRIQDAPGPAQTGVVPLAGPPVAPVNGDSRIQDAPGPAQTLPPLRSVTPSELPPVPTIPPQPPAPQPPPPPLR